MIYYVSSVSPVVHNLLKPEIFGFKLMQYTERKDSKKQEIYSGDILKKFKKDGSFYNKITIVEYKNGNHNVPYYTEDILKIGNIYDNPELLEEKK